MRSSLLSIVGAVSGEKETGGMVGERVRESQK